MHTPNIKSKEDVVHYVNEVGYLPFFRNHISGFFLEDMVEPIYWYDGFMKKTDKEIVDFLNDSGPMLTSQMKKELGFRKDGKSEFDAITNRLQMQTYIGVTEFRYKVAKKTGQPYGWGVTLLDTAEHCWSEDLCRGAYHRIPEESLERVLEKLSQSLLDCKEADIMKLIKA